MSCLKRFHIDFHLIFWYNNSVKNRSDNKNVEDEN